MTWSALIHEEVFEVVEIELNADEKKMFDTSVAGVKKLIDVILAGQKK